MRDSSTAIALLLAALLTGCAASAEPGKPQDRRARTMQVLESRFEKPRVAMAKSLPPQFSLIVEAEMPTPGYTFAIDEVRVDAENQRIVARVTEVAPSGMTAQVITPTACRIPLGYVDRGRYVVEIWSRRADGGTHALRSAMVLEAR